MIGSLYILVIIFTSALAQLFIKSGLRMVTTTDFASFMYGIVHQPFHAASIVFGIVLSITAIGMWITYYDELRSHSSYPTLSLTFLITYVFSSVWPWIYEEINIQKSIGIWLVIIGLWICHRYAPEANASAANEPDTKTPAAK